MLSDKDCCDLLQMQYDGKPSVFDYSARIGDVSVALKYYSDLTCIPFEGSHNIPDWYSNFQAWMIDVPGVGRVEKGFYDDMEQTVDDLVKRVQPDKMIVIPGHSRGAAHADICARLLIHRGFNPRLIRRVKFGEPRSGNIDYVKGFQDSPAVSYRNYGGPLDQDWVCDVPLHCLLEPYEPSTHHTIINMRPAPNDEWGFLARHHLFLYRAALS